MANTGFDPGRALGDRIKELGRQELCELVSKLCRLIRAEAGPMAFRGGVFPENISLDEQGEPALGPGKKDSWEGRELQFIAPELYWNGRRSPAADVYSLGLLLYYGVSGKLPYEGECEDAQLRRMGGEDIKAPRSAGRRLGEIIEKATRFKAADRYQSLEEMQVMLDGCVKNLYLNGAPSAEAIFNKNDDDLSEIERIMVGIIERGEEEPLPEPEAEQPAQAPSAAGEKLLEAEKPEAEPGQPELSQEKPEAEAEDVRLYTPEKKKPQKQKKPVPEPRPQTRQPIPILTEEKNPELEPVVLRQSVTPAVQYGKSAERERKIAQEIKKRRSHGMVKVLVLCAALIVTAIIANAMLKDFVWNDDDGGSSTPSNPSIGTVPTGDPDAVSGGVVVVPTPPAAEPTETPQPEKQSTYQILKEDLSWTEAQARCAELGGHLVVINDVDELERVIKLAEDAGVSRVWIGCHRENGSLVWENNEEVLYYNWGQGEPSYEDGYDGTAEDYLMLWNNGGWFYNDSRNDPAADYPDWYSGTMGFVCEIES